MFKSREGTRLSNISIPIYNFYEYLLDVNMFLVY